RQALVEVDVVAPLQVKADQGGVGDDLFAIADIGQLAPRRLAKAAAVRLERQAGHLQKHHGLGHEGTRVGEPPCRAESVERNHLPPSSVRAIWPSTQRLGRCPADTSKRFLNRIRTRFAKNW